MRRSGDSITILQFIDKPKDDSADVAWTSNMYKSHVRVDANWTLTCGGETSEINTNGTGPRPIAKDLKST
jgi:hypothetical protein